MKINMEKVTKEYLLKDLFGIRNSMFFNLQQKDKAVIDLNGYVDKPKMDAYRRGVTDSIEVIDEVIAKLNKGIIKEK